ERPLLVEEVEDVRQQHDVLAPVDLQPVVRVRRRDVCGPGPRPEPVDVFEPRSSGPLRNLPRVAVDRMCREGRQWLAGRERETPSDVETDWKLVVAVDLHVVRMIERQGSFAERAEEPDVAAIAELRHADGRVAWIVRRKIEQRRNPRIRLPVVVTEEP